MKQKKHKTNKKVYIVHSRDELLKLVNDQKSLSLILNKYFELKDRSLL